MLRFNRNGKFTILQVSDPQDLHIVRKTMVRMLGKAYDRINPDLVIFTGDNILGNHLRDAQFGSREVIHTREQEYERMTKALAHILEPVAKRHIPFTFIYGNHDDMNSFTKEEQNNIYRSYPNLVGLDNITPDIEAGTFNVPIYGYDGKKPVFNLWCFDSARRFEDGTGLEAVTESCLEWYKKESAYLRQQNDGKPLPSLIFQHIPMPEQKSLLEGCDAYSIGAKKWPGMDFIRLNPKLAKGTLGEPISAVEKDFGEADAIRECGDCVAVVTGHDHSNQFDGTVDGIRHIQTAAASFRCYGSRDRGVRVFVLDENNPWEIETYTLSYEDLCGNTLSARLSYIWDADGEQVKKAMLISGGVMLLGAAAGITKSIIKTVKSK